MISLKKQLIVWALGLFTVVGLLAGGISYLLAIHDANVLLDHQLLLVAGSIDEGSQLPAMQARFLGESEDERKSDFVIQVWFGKEPVRSSHPEFQPAERNRHRVFQFLVARQAVASLYHRLPRSHGAGFPG